MRETEKFEEDFNTDCELALQVLREKNEELKTDNKALKEKVHWWKKEVNVAHRARADEFENITIENKVLKEKLIKAKEIIKKFLLWENDWHNKTESKYELLKQAEQFLKE